MSVEITQRSEAQKLNEELSRAWSIRLAEQSRRPDQPVNQLGGLSGGESQGPRVEISYATLANRYRPKLATEAEIEKLDAAHDKIAELVKREEQHSPTLLAKKCQELQSRYASDPTPKALEELRHMQALANDYSTCSQVQFSCAQQRKAEAVAVSPICKRILVKAAEMAEAEAKSNEEHDRTLAAAYGVEHHRSPLAAALFRRATEFRNEAQAEVLTHISELCNELCTD